jgi:hypothetical protein
LTSRSSLTWITYRITPWLLPTDGRPRSRSGVPIDDPTAITVTDGTVEVVSEGDWRLFPS